VARALLKAQATQEKRDAAAWKGSPAAAGGPAEVRLSSGGGGGGPAPAELQRRLRWRSGGSNGGRSSGASAEEFGPRSGAEWNGWLLLQELLLQRRESHVSTMDATSMFRSYNMG